MKTKLITFPLLLIASLVAHAQEVEIKAHAVTESIYMLQGNGGNIGLSIGEDGVFMIDDQFAPLSEKIKMKVEELSSGQSVRFLLNTHWHGDHTGGNGNFSSDGAIIIAHDNVRKRLASGGEIKFFLSRTPPAKPSALPVITFSRDMALHWNDDTLKIEHTTANAHTDGDSVVYFQKANVVHMGDLFFNQLYPFIDYENGGSVKGVIDAVNQVLERIDGNTKVIPGHGALGDKAALVDYRDMLSAISRNVEQMKTEGKTLEEIVAAKPSANFDEIWGKGFLDPDTWVKLVYESL